MILDEARLIGIAHVIVHERAISTGRFFVVASLTAAVFVSGLHYYFQA